jgi:hypothetical protein
MRLLRHLVALVPCVLLVWTGCASDDERPALAERMDAGVDRISARPGLGPTPPPPPAAPPGDAGCNAVVDAPTLVPGNHLAEGTPIAYASNPPSSGPHYPRWANFQEYASPVADGYLVHSLEHGAVLLLYKCEPADCPAVIATLRAVRDSIATDPACDPSIRVRIILAPRPALDVPIAAAAWGFTYKAECIDVPSLTQFVREHYAKAPEDFCAKGSTTF